MSEFLVEEMQHNKGAKIKVIGCGGGGGNMINHMVKMGLNDLDLIAANTDAQAISNSLAKTKIQLGEKKTKGLGAGMLPE
ncbi:cell division protein FtsZ, partial [Campylobacter coli]|nr:cell division protein FtsZ [Campylobacter coli]